MLFAMHNTYKINVIASMWPITQQIFITFDIIIQ